jgi:tRNA A-37 threonylcarbamoyl transferase component Bud32
MSGRASLEGRITKRLPTGYEDVRSGTGRAWVWGNSSEWCTAVLAKGRTLHDWAVDREETIPYSGRGLVYSVPAAASGPTAAPRWAVRHYRRGGAMAMHMSDRYLRTGHPRPFRELEASVVAGRRGIPTPSVVAGATYADGPYYRCDLVTEVVPSAKTLADVLQETDGTRGWLVAMARAGGLIRRLGSAGIFHVDLNARNVLLQEWQDSSRPEDDAGAWVIDLDRARIFSRQAESAAERMQVRLTRSIIKNGTPTGESLRDSEIEAALTTRLEEL